MPKTVSGRVLLRSFLDENKLTYTACARALGLSHVAVRAWVLALAVPSPEHRQALEVWTSGKVPASSWPMGSTPSVKPFKATGS